RAWMQTARHNAEKNLTNEATA
ncbi:aminotransferase, partial [Vibrio cholerae]